MNRLCLLDRFWRGNRVSCRHLPTVPEARAGLAISSSPFERGRVSHFVATEHLSDLSDPRLPSSHKVSDRSVWPLRDGRATGRSANAPFTASGLPAARRRALLARHSGHSRRAGSPRIFRASRNRGSRAGAFHCARDARPCRFSRIVDLVVDRFTYQMEGFPGSRSYGLPPQSAPVLEEPCPGCGRSQ
jgi:hypothetical protein